MTPKLTKEKRAQINQMTIRPKFKPIKSNEALSKERVKDKNSGRNSHETRAKEKSNESPKKMKMGKIQSMDSNWGYQT